MVYFMISFYFLASSETLMKKILDHKQGGKMLQLGNVKDFLENLNGFKVVMKRLRAVYTPRGQATTRSNTRRQVGIR